MSRSNKNRRRKRRKTKKAGNSPAHEKFKKKAEEIGKKKAFQKQWDIEIGTSIKKIQKHFPEESRRATLQKTEEALKKRAERKSQFDKIALRRPPRVDSVNDTNILGMERSRDKIESLTRKKQKKSDKKFFNVLKNEINIVLTDKSHPNHFNERRKRILNLVKDKDEKSYREICGYTNPSQSNTGCSKKIYEKIEPNGKKRGTDLLDVISKKYGIAPKMELVRKRTSAKKRSASAGRKRRRKTKKNMHIITRKNKRKRRRRTKKRKKGGMPKGPAPKKSGLLPPNTGVIKPKHIRLRQLKKGLTRNLKQLTKFKPIEEKSKMNKDLDSELSNIFGNMKTPTVGDRSQNTEKMFSSKIEPPKQ